MKKYSIYIIMLVFGFTACKKLDVTPPDRLSTGLFWKQESDADLALAGIYASLRAEDGQTTPYAPMMWDNFSDNSYSQNNQGSSQQSLIGGLTPSIGGFPTSLYISSYKGIAAANSFLANVDKVLTGDKLRLYKGEAFFLRAFHYFMLAQTYGNAPVITEDPLTIDFRLHVKKSTRADVYTLIEADLDSAIDRLPDAAYTTGHVVKGSAQGLKAKVMLTQHKYVAAAALAKAVIDRKLFSLNSNYAGNFYKPDQRASNEIMFSVQFQAPAVPQSFSITIMLLGAGYKDVQITQDLVNEYEPNDPRKTMSIFFPGDTPAQGWPYPGIPATPGVVNYWTQGFYLPKKWIDPKVVDPQPGRMDDQDYVWLRFADVKLMYAEAQNEVAGPDASVYTQVNDVRARPSVNMPALPAGLTKDQMRARIMHERRVELALEGSRYFDLRRWGLAKQKLDGFVQNPLTPTIKTIYKDNFEYWPLPQTEVDRNKPELVQNDDY